MGGAQLATMTFFAPTSFAIWTISFEVVPRTMESARHQHPISNTGQTKAHTINDEDVLVRKLERHRVKLPTHVLAAHLLAGHDERAADVPVLDEPFAVRQAELLREVERGDAGRVRDGDDDVDGDVVRGEHALHLVRERVAHRHARAVDADPVEDRVWPDRKSTRLNSSHSGESRMPSSA